MTYAETTIRQLAGSLDWKGRSGRAALAVSLCVLYATVFLGRPFLPDNVFFPLIGVLLLVSLGQLRRRLRDVGWRGGWLWVTQIPIVGLVLQLILLVRRSSDKPRYSEPQALRRFGFAIALTLAMTGVARGFFFGIYWIPSGSMKPYLLPGDYILAVTLTGLPERGDVVTFSDPACGATFVQRVIGLPNDQVQMRDGRVELNGTILPQRQQLDFVETFEPQGRVRMLPRCANNPAAQGGTCTKARYTETLPSGRSYDVLNITDSWLDETRVFNVPAGHIFVLGDNRDNVRDSRMSLEQGGPGFVPVAQLKERVYGVVFSMNGDTSRLFRRLK